MADHDYKHGGWKDKYVIFKNKIIGTIGGSITYHDDPAATNKAILPIFEQVDPMACYFVLRIDEDIHARRAARAYADSVRAENAVLADDIINKLSQYK